MSSLVVVVDDDTSVLQALELLLESQDYRVLLFASPAALLESGALAQADCLISDVDMPGMDGFELLARVDAARPGLPAILITGFPDRLDRSPPPGRVPRVFTKPFLSGELLAAVRDALREPRR
jgi:FixJ family two-component response regulator